MAFLRLDLLEWLLLRVLEYRKRVFRHAHEFAHSAGLR